MGAVVVIVDGEKVEKYTIGALNLHIPSSLPSWISEEKIQFFAQKFDETGFTGGLNYYRAIIEGPSLKNLYQCC
ncbi:hypothetical protein Syun_025523 [Stephania yunnanensis]|uniref:Uncharacterized protein n=1 Tax=Stephania yunnanensis TaxID=152371 RepID=A0AAP0EXD2_9MAGN